MVNPKSSNQFDWQSQLSTVYASFPEAQRRPVIGITGNYGEFTCKLADGYYRSVQQAGGVPIIIPPLANTDSIINTLEHIDGLILSGGADYNPLYANEEPIPALGGINSERDLPELLITRLAYNRQIPILGICRGIQTLAMALGGKVRQDISQSTIKHSQDAERSEPTHSVTVKKDSTLYYIYNKEEKLFVNSFHHQAVGDAGQVDDVAKVSEVKFAYKFITCVKGKQRGSERYSFGLFAGAESEHTTGSGEHYRRHCGGDYFH